MKKNIVVSVFAICLAPLVYCDLKFGYHYIDTHVADVASHFFASLGVNISACLISVGIPISILYLPGLFKKISFSKKVSRHLRAWRLLGKVALASLVPAIIFLVPWLLWVFLSIKVPFVTFAESDLTPWGVYYQGLGITIAQKYFFGIYLSWAITAALLFVAVGMSVATPEVRRRFLIRIGIIKGYPSYYS